MSSLSSFPLFSSLPTELRLQIWERAPRPQRIIGHVPCPHCLDGTTSPVCRLSHLPWGDYYFVQPRDQAIHPLLHTCRESRAVLLQWYDQPLSRVHPELEVRFDVPFINYTDDLFAVYEEHLPDETYDPFVGLDRSRIQHVAFTEIPARFIESLISLKCSSLTSLRSLSLLVCGPRPSEQVDGRYLWVQTRKPYLPFHQCQIRDLSLELLQNHPFFGKYRPRHPFVTLDPRVQGVADYMVLFKAWLWHAFTRDMTNTRVWREDPWWEFLEYVVDDTRDTCPLSPLPGCGPGGHKKWEMHEWEPSFELGCKMLCEETWLERLDTLESFDIDLEGQYQPFLQFLYNETVVGVNQRVSAQMTLR